MVYFSTTSVPATRYLLASPRPVTRGPTAMTLSGRGSHAGLRQCANRLRTVVFQAALKAGLRPAPASSGPVCPGIALLLAHCLAARPLPPAHALGDGAKPPENQQNLAVDALREVREDWAAMKESEKQFSFTRAALSTCGRAKGNFLSVSVSLERAAHAVEANSAARGDLGLEHSGRGHADSSPRFGFP